ncbi:MAG: hypothetical protein KIT68_05590 [Phycisphaeraceae bacterium]|nr:hypothetical protein [Phycisphaeraceae bacterium]
MNSKQWMMSIVAAAGLATAAWAVMEQPKDAPKPAATQPAPDKSKDTNSGMSKPKAGEGEAVEMLETAGNLVAYARANESAYAMLAAVDMIRRVQVKTDAAHFGQKQAEGGKDAPGDQKDKTPKAWDVKKLLEEAKGWAKNDAKLAAVIDAELAKPAPEPGKTMGAVGGPIQIVDCVRGGYTDIWTVSFEGGKLAQVGVIGDGDTDLDLVVYDEGGHLIGTDVDGTDRCLVQWTPRWTGKFKLHIRNMGRIPNCYRLLTN